MWSYLCSKKCESIINMSLENPVLLSSDNDAELQASRVICSTNVIHQADCILRRLLTEHLTSAKGLFTLLSFVLQREIQ